MFQQYSDRFLISEEFDRDHSDDGVDRYGDQHAERSADGSCHQNYNKYFKCVRFYAAGVDERLEKEDIYQVGDYENADQQQDEAPYAQFSRRRGEVDQFRDESDDGAKGSSGQWTDVRDDIEDSGDGGDRQGNVGFQSGDEVQADEVQDRDAGDLDRDATEIAGQQVFNVVDRLFHSLFIVVRDQGSDEVGEQVAVLDEKVADEDHAEQADAEIHHEVCHRTGDGGQQVDAQELLDPSGHDGLDVEAFSGIGEMDGHPVIEFLYIDAERGGHGLKVQGTDVLECIPENRENFQGNEADESIEENHGEDGQQPVRCMPVLDPDFFQHVHDVLGDEGYDARDRDVCNDVAEIPDDACSQTDSSGDQNGLGQFFGIFHVSLKKIELFSLVL